VNNLKQLFFGESFANEMTEHNNFPFKQIAVFGKQDFFFLTGYSSQIFIFEIISTTSWSIPLAPLWK